MKEKTYLRMTKKQPMRGLKKFKSKYLTKDRFYALLAKIKLVREVRNSYTVPIKENEYMNRIMLSQDKITTDRGVFNISYRCEGVEHITKWWYESIFKPHKILHIVMNEKNTVLTAEVRSECEEFEVRFDPFNYTRVSRRNNCVYLPESHREVTLCPNDVKVSKFTRFEVNLLNARFKAAVSLNVDLVKNTIEELVDECVNRAKVQVRNFIENNSEAINEKLTGVKFDGEFTSPDGQRLLHNCTCPKCGLPLFKSSVEGYTAQCVACDEDFYDVEVRKVDPEEYKRRYDNCKYILSDIVYQ